MKPWLDRIIEAKAKGGFTQGDRDDAAFWRTCSVGEVRQTHKHIVRYDPIQLKPFDPTLCKLGERFYEAVDCDLMDSAEQTFYKIQDRVLELKRRTT